MDSASCSRRRPCLLTLAYCATLPVILCRRHTMHQQLAVTTQTWLQHSSPHLLTVPTLQQVGMLNMVAV